MLHQARVRRAKERTKMRGDNIHSTDFHDGGAIACCSFCGRYSDDSRSLSADTFPCDCGRSGGWCGSFKTPTEESKWSDLKPEPTKRLVRYKVQHNKRLSTDRQ
jgi:hypothetical protein